MKRCEECLQELPSHDVVTISYVISEDVREVTVCRDCYSWLRTEGVFKEGINEECT